MDESSISDRIVKLRNRYAYSQEYVAQQLGIDRQTYLRLETGQVRYFNANLKPLADLFGISLERLLTGFDPNDSPSGCLEDGDEVLYEPLIRMKKNFTKRIEELDAENTRLKDEMSALLSTLKEKEETISDKVKIISLLERKNGQ